MGREMLKEFLSASNLLLASFCAFIGFGHGLMLTQGGFFARIHNPSFWIIMAASTSTYYAWGLHIRLRHQRERRKHQGFVLDIRHRHQRKSGKHHNPFAS